MGSSLNATDIQKLFDNFAKEINTKLDPLKEQIASIDTHLANIEQGCQTEEEKAAAKLQHDRKLTATKLEGGAKRAMEAASRAYLKEAKEKASSQTILEIIDVLKTKLFDVFKDTKEALEANTPPSHLTPRLHKLSFPTYDGKKDLLPWINRCEQFFRGQKTPENDQVWYASYHLIGLAQQ